MGLVETVQPFHLFELFLRESLFGSCSLAATPFFRHLLHLHHRLFQRASRSQARNCKDHNTDSQQSRGNQQKPSDEIVSHVSNPFLWVGNNISKTNLPLA